MTKLGLLLSLSLIIGGLTVANMSKPEAQPAPAPCVTKEFKTEMINEACAKGGQKAAKEAMKAWNKEKKINSCNKCHAKLAPNYDLKKDGLEQYRKLGGKVIEETRTTTRAPKVVVLVFAKTAMVDGASLSDAALERVLREAIARDKDTVVSFSQDEGVSSQRFMALYAIVKRVGVTKFGAQSANYTDPDNPPKEPVVTIDMNGTFYLDKRIVVADALDRELAKLAKKKVKRAVIAVDSTVTLDAIEKLIARCKAAGLDVSVLE